MIKQNLRLHMIDTLQTATQTQKSLRFYKDKLEPELDYSIKCGVGTAWWLKARVGGFLLNDRTDPGGGCPCCNRSCTEDLPHHLFDCDISSIVKLEMCLPTSLRNFTSEEKCVFSLALERPAAQRERIGLKIKEIWELRRGFLNDAEAN